MKINKLIAFLCMILIVLTPLQAVEVSKPETPEEKYNPNEPTPSSTTTYTGTPSENVNSAIIVQVQDYQPKMIPTSVIEKGQVPIYVFLSGNTLGQIAFGEGSSQIEPFYGVPKIKSVQVYPSDVSRKYVVGSPPYIPSGKYQSLDNLGYLIVLLQKIPKEKDVPDTINLNMTMKIEFDTERGFGDISRYDVTTSESLDESSWKNDPTEFWNRRGFIRASDVTDSKARITVYDGNLRQISQFVLSSGEKSPILFIPGLSAFFNDQFQVKLNEISEPKEKATIIVNVNGIDKEYTISKGMSIYPGSNWVLDDIQEDYDEKKQEITESITIKSSIGDRKIIKHTYESKPITIQKNSINNKWNNLLNALKGYTSLFGNILEKTTNTITIATKRQITTFLRIAKGLGVSTDNLIHSQVIPLKQEELTQAEKNIEEKYCNANIEDKDIKDDKTAENAKALYCISIKESKEVISKYPSSSVLPETLFNIGEAYKGLADVVGKYEKKGDYKSIFDVSRIQGNDGNEKFSKLLLTISRSYFKKVLSYKTNKAIEAQQKIDEIELLLLAGGKPSDPVLLEDESVYVSLKETIPISLTEQTSATIEIDGVAKEYYREGEVLTGKEESNLFSWRISTITRASVGLVKINNKGQTTGDTFNLELEKLRDLPKTITQGKLTDTSQVKLTKVNSKKEVSLTLLPGQGRAISESSFTIHVPIEKRPFQFTPEQIDHQINETQKLINQLDEYIRKLNDVTKTWKATCLVTFAALTIKNSFLGGTARNQARKDVVPYYKDKCKTELTRGNENFNTLDKCLSYYSDEMDKAIASTQKNIEEVNKYMSNKIYESDSNYKSLKDIEQNTGISTPYSDKNKLRDLKLLELKTGDKTLPSDLKKQAEDKYNEAKTNFDNEVEAANIAAKNTKVEDIKAFGELSKKEQNSEITKYYDIQTAVLTKKSQVQADTDILNKASNSLSLPKETNLNTLPVVYEGPNQIYSSYTTNIDNSGKITGVTSVSQLNKLTLEKAPDTFEQKKDINDKITKLNNDINKLSSSNKGEDITTKNNLESQKSALENKLKIDTVQIDGRDVFIDNSNKYYLAMKTYYGQGAECSPKFQKGQPAQFDEQGRPILVPYKGGRWVEVLEYYSTGSPKTIRELCYDNNGKQLIKTTVSELDNPNWKSQRTELDNYLNNVPQCKKNGKITAQGQIFNCDTTNALAAKAAASPNCADVMDQDDCVILYNACDPVMCPASRMNLGGAWQVSSVPETGIIGSIVLGLPNFPQTIVPVCITGILAGLRNIKTILEGYMQCLQTSKIEGRSVGICDQIRSIGVCEMVWKEVVAIFNIHGGVISFLSEKLFGQIQGGGEYLTFQDSLQNVADSVSFFTKDYAKSAFAAYLARSTEEIGSEICKSAIYGKLPDIGEMFNQLTEPENPPQFTAWFDETPWVTTAGKTYTGLKEESRYSIYYHIYAGKAPTFNTGIQRNEVQYSVYLQGQGLRLPVTDPERKLTRAAIPQGGYVDKSVEALGPANLNEICIELNGQVSCGFGKVSSSFSLKYAADQIVAAEAKKKIENERQCVPDSPTTGASLGNIVMPRNYGALSTGLVRVCSTSIPSGDWRRIGTCGKNAQGMSLGECWLDLRSIQVNDQTLKNEILNQTRYNELEIEGKGKISDLMKSLYTVEKSRAVLSYLDTDFNNIEKEKNPLNKINDIKDLFSGKSITLDPGPQPITTGYRIVAENSVDTQSQALAQAKIGYIYLKLADWTKLKLQPVVKPAVPTEKKEERKAEAKKPEERKKTESFPTTPIKSVDIIIKNLTCDDCGNGLFNTCDKKECEIEIGKNIKDGCVYEGYFICKAKESYPIPLEQQATKPFIAGNTGIKPSPEINLLKQETTIIAIDSNIIGYQIPLLIIDEEHTLTINSIVNDIVRITIKSDPKEYYLYLNREKKVEVGNQEITLILKKVEGKLKLEIKKPPLTKKIEESKPVSKPVSEEALKSFLTNILKTKQGTDKEKWSSIIIQAMQTSGMPLTKEYASLILAIIERESSFQLDPIAYIPDFYEAYKDKMGAGYFEKDLKTIKTEKELLDFINKQNWVYRTILKQYKIPKTLGPMQVDVDLAISLAKKHEDKVYTEKEMINLLFKEEGLKYGVYLLKEISELYTKNNLDENAIKFIAADYNLGLYSSKNAAFQKILNDLLVYKKGTDKYLTLDGDLGPKTIDVLKVYLEGKNRNDLIEELDNFKKENGIIKNIIGFQKTDTYKFILKEYRTKFDSDAPDAVIPDIKISNLKAREKYISSLEYVDKVYEFYTNNLKS